MLNTYAYQQVTSPHRIVIVGGCATGMKLAVLLGKALGRQKRAAIILLDDSLTTAARRQLNFFTASRKEETEYRTDCAAIGKPNFFGSSRARC